MENDFSTGIWITDLDGRILHHYTALEHLAGFEKQETVGKVFDPAWLMAEDIALAEAALGKCLKQGVSQKLQVGCNTGDNQEIQFEIICSPHLDNNRCQTGAVILITAVDSGSDQNSKLSFIDSNLETICNMLPVPVIVSRVSDGATLYANENSADFFGKTLAEILKSHVEEFIEDINNKNGLYERLFAAGELKNYECHSRRTDRKESWFSVSAKVVVCNGEPAILTVFHNTTERRQVERALRESERKFRELADLLPQIIFELDLKAKITFGNKSGFIVTGYTPEDLEKGLNAAELFIPEDRLRATENIKKVLGREILNDTEYTMLKKDGSTFPVATYSVPAFCGNRIVGIRGIVIDITKRKQAEDARRESEEKYRTLVESAGEAIFTLDKDGVFLFMNSVAAQRIKGKPEDFIGKTMWKFFPADVAERQMSNVRKVIESGIGIIKDSVLEIQGQQLRYSTSMQPIKNQSGATSSVLCIARDITEFVKTQQELEIERDFIRSLMDTANSLIVCLDNQARITVFNRECEKVTGYMREEVIGKCWLEIFIPKEVHHDGLKNFTDWVRRHPRDMYEGPLKTKTGEIRTILWSNSAMFSTDSDELTAIAVGHDITDRKQAEDELRKFKTISEKANYGTAISELDGTIVYANQAFAGMHGYQPDELIGKNLLVLHTREQLSAVEKFIEQLMREGHYTAEEVWHKKRNGDVFPTLMNATVIKDEEGVGLFLSATAIDITAYKQAAEALRHSEEKYRLLVQNVAASIALMSYEGEFLFINDEGARKHGKDADEIIGKTMWDLFPPEVADLQMQRVRNVIDSGREFTEKSKTFLNGKWRWFDIKLQPFVNSQGKSSSAMIIARDVTKRRQAETALKESEEKFRLLSEQSMLGIIIIQEEKIQFVNRAAAEITGYSIEEMLSWTMQLIAKRILPEDSAYVMDQLSKEQPALKDVVHHYAYRILTKGGSTKWIEQYSRSILYGGKHANLVTIIDITDRRYAEEALETANRRLSEEQRRLTEKNIALQEILSQIDSEKKQIQEQIQSNVDRIVMPMLVNLRQRISPSNRIALELLGKSLADIVSPFINKLETRYSHLTPREVEICDLIRVGMQSKEIASILNITVRTVEKFRQQIRKKLGLANKRVNLTSFLRSL